MEPKASAQSPTAINEQDWEVRNDNGFVFMSPKRRRVDPSPDPPPPSSSSTDLQRAAPVVNEDNWDVLKDAGFVFMRPKSLRVDPTPDPVPQAPPSSSSDLPEDPNANSLQNQYQTEINQWVILSSTLRAFVGVACDKLERLRAESAASAGSGSSSDELQGSKSDRKSLVALVHSMMPLLTEANSQGRSQVVPPPARNAPTESPVTPGTAGADDTKPRRRVSTRRASKEMIPVELGRAKRSAKSPKYLEDFVPIEMKGKVVFFKNNVSETS